MKKNVDILLLILAVLFCSCGIKSDEAAIRQMQGLGVIGCFCTRKKLTVKPRTFP